MRPGTRTCFLDPIPYDGIPCLALIVEGLGLALACNDRLVDSPREVLASLRSR